MADRRDIHGQWDHDSCPDAACCNCECRGCKRTWFEEGRPSPNDCTEHSENPMKRRTKPME